MGTRYDERYEGDETPSREVVARYREVVYDDDPGVSLALVHYRGGDEEFALGREYSASADPGDRATGAAILGQLGWGDRTFLSESVEILTRLLDDPDDFVVYCAAMALGHRGEASAIASLLRHAGHADPCVRYGVVHGLSGHEDPGAIAALIRLAADDDHDVRNWAVFGIGSLIDADSPEIRAALRRALADPDGEIRGEALVGLAARGDSAIVPDLIAEWARDEVGILSLEAAELAGDRRLFGALNQLAGELTLDDDPHFAAVFRRAIEACKPRAEREGGFPC
jgi:HEAT repeat protein